MIVHCKQIKQFSLIRVCLRYAVLKDLKFEGERIVFGGRIIGILRYAKWTCNTILQKKLGDFIIGDNLNKLNTR